jgi:hypothetical protein
MKTLTETEAKILLNNIVDNGFGYFAKLENTKLNTDYKYYVQIPNIEEITDIEATAIDYDNDFRRYDSADQTVEFKNLNWHDVKIGHIVNGSSDDISSWYVVETEKPFETDLALAQAIYDNAVKHNNKHYDELFESELV